jgi:putative drug exporter of the RND superfamily
VLTLPALRMELTSSGAELLPRGTPEREFVVDFRERYPLLSGSEVTVVTRGAPVDEVRAWATESADRPGAESVDPVRVLPGGVVTVGFQTGDDGAGPASRELTADLRSDRPPFEQAWVVGQASGITDFRATVADRALWAVGAVVAATLVLLFLMTGSVVIPVKALVMNVLSLGATLGLLVWIFQDGNLEGLLRFTSAASRTPCRCSLSPSGSACPWTTRCSCSPGWSSSAGRATTRRLQCGSACNARDASSPRPPCSWSSSSPGSPRVS